MRRLLRFENLKNVKAQFFEKAEQIEMKNFYFLKFKFLIRKISIVLVDWENIVEYPAR